jgi:heme exporter protein CcmD
MDSLFNSLQMGGYAAYVWSAYGLALSILALQLFLPWKRWRKLAKKQKSAGE